MNTKSLVEEWTKYFVWIKSSGIHGAELLKAYTDFWIGNRSSEIQEIIEMAEKMKIIPTEIPHLSPYISGYNGALNDIVAKLKERL